MANPRRNSYSNSNSYPHPHPHSSSNEISETSSITKALLLFLKKPHAFPFLLSVFIVLTWLSLRLQHSSSSQFSSPQPHQSLEDDKKANLFRFFPSQISTDKRGWILNPISLALDARISGGAVSCASVHLGEIRPGGFRGNHRHYTCNETFIIWGAITKFRLEKNEGYAEVVVGADEVAVAASPSGTAHALVNMDPIHTSYFMGCQDSIINYNTSTSDFNVWKDL